MDIFYFVVIRFFHLPVSVGRLWLEHLERNNGQQCTGVGRSEIDSALGWFCTAEKEI